MGFDATFSMYRPSPTGVRLFKLAPNVGIKFSIDENIITSRPRQKVLYVNKARAINKGKNTY